MTLRRILIFGAATLAAGLAFAASASMAAVRAYDDLTEAIAAFGASVARLFDLAFPASPTPLYAGFDLTPPAVLGAASARSFRERRRARLPSSHSRAPLSRSGFGGLLSPG